MTGMVDAAIPIQALLENGNVEESWQNIAKVIAKTERSE
jgi:hypothetical protein